MINESNGKIIIETKEDKRLEVAIELAKTVNNLADMLKKMDTSISNIRIDGCHIQTVQGETALYMGNNVKDSVFSNSIVQTYPPESSNLSFNEDDNDEDDFEEEDNDLEEEEFEEDPAYAESIATFHKTKKDDSVVDTKQIRDYAFSQTDLMNLSSQHHRLINVLCDEIDRLKEKK